MADADPRNNRLKATATKQAGQCPASDQASVREVQSGPAASLGKASAQAISQLTSAPAPVNETMAPRGTWNLAGMERSQDMRAAWMRQEGSALTTIKAAAAGA